MDDCIVTIQSAAEPDSLDGYGDVPIAFWVRTRYVVTGGGDVSPNTLLVEESVDPPYLKDYDAIPGEGPTQWRRWLDISNWTVLRAYIDGAYVGASVIAWKTAELAVLEDRDDLAILWDIRVHPDYRGRRVGQRLFAEVEAWSRVRGCSDLKIETQNINVPACKFYTRMGCELRRINLGVFADVPEEAQFFWYKAL